MAAQTDSGRVVAGRYRLITGLGRGGMGAVWLAEDQLLRRRVAVKEVFPPAGVSPEERDMLRERTLREARAAARLSHPNVVTVYDIAEDSGQPWIVMELVLSRSLREIVQDDGPLDPGATARVGLQVLAALRAAHALGILHRDVKPGNVLIEADGRAVLADFGIAREQDSLATTTSGVIVGSPSYIAPERARGEPGGPESDAWSLGATLYAAVEGRPPYDRGGALPTLMAVVSEQPDPPRRAGPLWPVISGLLEPDRDRRLSLATAEPMLRRVAEARPARDTVPFPAPGRRHRADQADADQEAVPTTLERAERTRAFHPAITMRVSEPGPEAAPSGDGAAETLESASTPETPATDGAPEPPERHDTTETAEPDSLAQVPQPDSAPETPEPDSAPEPPERHDTTETAEPDSPAQAPQPDSAPETAEPDSLAQAPQPDSAPETPEPHGTAVGAAVPAVEILGRAPTSRPHSTQPHSSQLDSGSPSPGTSPPDVSPPGSAAEPTDRQAAAAAVPTGRGRSPSRRQLGWLAGVAAVAVGLAAVALGLNAAGHHAAPSAAHGDHSAASAPARTSSARTRASSAPASAPRASSGPTSAASPSLTPGSGSASTTPSHPAASPTNAAPNPGSGSVGPARIPAGFYRYRDVTGFSIAVPDGWHVSHQGGYVYVTPSAGAAFLLIDQSDQPKPDPLADWRQQEANREASYPGYHRIRLVAIKYPQAEKAADWEFTYYRQSVLTHVLNRNILANSRHAYALYWSTPESEWASDLAIFKVFSRTFRPAPP